VYDVPVGQDINTDLLYPVNFSQTGAKFVFQQVGVLDSNSQIILSQTCNQVGAAEQECYLPTATGALAMVRRAWLTIGGRRVSNLDEVGHYNTWRRLHFSNEYKEGVAIPKQGGADIFVGSAARAKAGAASTTAVEANGLSATNPNTGGGYGTLGRVSSEYSKNPANGLQLANAAGTSTPAGDVITSNAATTPQYSVGLQQLIPFMIGVQIPLFAIQEEVALNIEWADNTVGHRFEVPSANAGNANAIFSTMVENSCFIVADYLHFPSQMETLRDEIMNKGGFDIPYDEIQLTTHTTEALAAGSVNTEVQIPLGGKSVKSIVVQQQLVDGANERINNIGRYNSMALRNGQSVNLTIDSKPFYANALANPSLQLSEANAVEGGVPLQECMYRYSWNNQVGATGTNSKLGLSDREYNGYGNSSECGSQFWVGIKLENMMGRGVRMSNLPAIFNRRSTVDAAAPDVGNQHRLRFFAKTARMLNISGGVVNMIE
ncbi:MAG: hypothetical protein ACR2M9_01920, partial [Cyanophyceae cyanobacterium]